MSNYYGDDDDLGDRYDADTFQAELDSGRPSLDALRYGCGASSGPALGAFAQARRRRQPWRYPCPTCKTAGALSADQKARGYQCNACADRDEGRL